jgi:predicted amidohydrolase YtcJ
MGRTACLEDIAGAVGLAARSRPEGRWILGFGYDDTLLAEKSHPLAASLDRAAPRHPVALSHISGHFLAVNSLALSLAGLGRDSPDPPGGRIRRLPDGRPSGLLEEPPAMGPVERLFPELSLEEERRALAWASSDYASKGLTLAQDGYSQERDLWLLEKAKENSQSHIPGPRLQAWPAYGSLAPEAWPKASGAFLTEGGGLILGPVKLFADGSIQGYTGYLSQPYHRVVSQISDGPSKAAWRGYPMARPDILKERILAVQAQGRQAAVHGNGDAAIDIILEGMEEAQLAYPRPVSPGHIVVHAQTARPDQLKRMAALGVRPSFFPAHVLYWGDRHRDIFLGPERASNLNPLRGAFEAGLIFSLHNDSPVTPINPLLLMETAVLRLTSSGKTLGGHQAIGAREALLALTAWPAAMAGLDKSLGRLAPGYLADLVILGRNPLKVPPEEISKIEILSAMVGGKIIHGQI